MKLHFIKTSLAFLYGVLLGEKRSSDKVVAGNVLATGSIDLVVNTGYTGMSSAISTAAPSSHKSTISLRNRNSKKNNYMRNMRPRKVFDKWIRKGGHIYHVWKYLYHGKLYTRWEKLR